MPELPPLPTASSLHDPLSGEAKSAAPEGARARKRAETHERLFKIALEEFGSEGVANAQVDRIAKRAGVVRGTFYFHFPTKDDVLLEYGWRVNRAIAGRVAALADLRLPIRSLLSKVNECMLEEHGRIEGDGLLRDVLALYVRRPQSIEAWDPEQPTLDAALSEQLQDLVDRGELSGRPSAPQISVLFLSSLTGLHTRVEGEAELAGACDLLIDLFVKGLQASSR